MCSRGSPMHLSDFAILLSLISMCLLVVSFALVKRTVACAGTGAVPFSGCAYLRHHMNMR